MNKLLAFFIVLTTTFSFGQIALDQQHFSIQNESFIFSTLNDNSIDFTQTGPNYIWDFSNLVPTNQIGLVTKPVSESSQFSQFVFGAFAATDYRASYFNTLAENPFSDTSGNFPITIDDFSLFTKNNPSAINSIGYQVTINGEGIPAKSDTIETRYVLPLSFGNNYSSRGYTNLDLNPFYDAIWRQHRYRQTEVDGWGSVSTPYGSFNALRIHHTIQEIDSFYLTFNGVGTWFPVLIPEAHEYEWRAIEDHEAVMRIRTSVNGGNQQVRSIEYRDDYNGLGVEDQTVQFSIGPNPVVNQLQLVSQQNMNEVVVIDATGKICIRVLVQSKTAEISTLKLEKGIYTVVVLSDSGFKSQKFIKQ